MPLAPEVTAARGHWHCWEEVSSQGADWDPRAVSKSEGSRGMVRGSRLLGLVSVLLEFGVDDFQCGQEVAKEEDQECERQHEHLGGGQEQGERRKRLPALIGSPPSSAHPTPGPQNRLSTSYPQTAGFCRQKAELWTNGEGRESLGSGRVFGEGGAPPWAPHSTPWGQPPRYFQSTEGLPEFPPTVFQAPVAERSEQQGLIEGVEVGRAWFRKEFSPSRLSSARPTTTPAICTHYTCHSLHSSWLESSNSVTAL